MSHDLEDMEDNIVVPQTLAKQRGKGVKLRRALQGAYQALWAMDDGSFLTPEQQKTIWPYLTWPPIPQWHILRLETDTEKAGGPHSLAHTVDSGDHALKHALAGIFQPRRRVYAGQLFFNDLLIPIFFRHQEDGFDVYMWGVVHYRKGSDVAYFHVLTKWQEDVYDINIRAWAKSFSPQSIFGGRLKDCCLKVVIVAHDQTLDLRAFTQATDLGEWSRQTFFYTIHVIRHLMLLGAGDNQIPRFDLHKHGPQCIVQLLVGISASFTHAGVRLRHEWQVSIMEKDDENAPLYHQVCREVRNAFEQSDLDLSGTSASSNSSTTSSITKSVDLDGDTFMDSPSSAECSSPCVDKQKDNEAARESSPGAFAFAMGENDSD